MRRLSITGLQKSLLVIGLVLCCAISECLARDSITVVTYSKKYENVSYVLNRAGNQITLLWDEAEIEINFGDIRFIYDQAGNDITDNIITGNISTDTSNQITPIDSVFEADSAIVEIIPDPANEIELISVVTDSKNYDLVAYKTDAENKVLLVEQDGWETSIPFSDIMVIYDKNQNNVTSTILQDKPVQAASDSDATEKSPASGKPKLVGKKENWLSEYSETIQNAKRKSWQIGLERSGNYSIPASSYYDGIDAGIGFEGVLHISLNYETALRIGISRAGLKDADEIHFYPTDPNLTLLEQDLSFTAMRYNIGAEYYRNFDKKKRDLNFWYVYSSVGAVAHKSTITGIMRNDDSGIRTPFKDTFKETKFDLIVGAGVMKDVYNNLGLEISASCDVVFLGKDPERNGTPFEDNIVYAYIFDFKIGFIGLF